MIVNIHQSQGFLNVSYVDTDRQIKILEIPLTDADYWNWDYSSRPTGESVISWDGKPVYKRNSNFLNRYRIDELLYNLPKEWKDKLKELNVPKKAYFDIETGWDPVNGWSKPENATNPILTNSIINEDNELTVFGLKKLTRDEIIHIESEIRKETKDDSIKFEYLFFESEKEMLNFCFREHMSKYGLLTGWNVINYDWKYLWNRSKLLNCREINKMSPIGSFITDDNLPVHKMLVDYMQIYSKWDRTVDIKENNTLDFVAKATIGFNKLKMPKSLQEMYDYDFVQYCIYNGIDSVLVKKIDEKIDTMGTFLGLGNICGSEYHKTFSPIWLTECVMHEEFINRGRRFIPRKDFGNLGSASYEGAWVKDPIPSLYKWLTVFDFASLYPTSQRQFNISPESYLGKFIPDVGDKTKILCASGAVFDGTYDSCMRTVLERLFNMRKAVKDDGKEWEKSLEILKKIKKETNHEKI